LNRSDFIRSIPLLTVNIRLALSQQAEPVSVPGIQKSLIDKEFHLFGFGCCHLDDFFFSFVFYRLSIKRFSSLFIMDYEEDQLIEQTRLCQLEELASDR
jgi:hypothetical protein